MKENSGNSRSLVINCQKKKILIECRFFSKKKEINDKKKMLKFCLFEFCKYRGDILSSEQNVQKNKKRELSNRASESLSST